MASSERTAAGTETSAAARTTTGASGDTAAGAGSNERLSRPGDQAGPATAAASGPLAAATPLEARTISCLTNAQYHSSREAFLDTVHRWLMFAVIALGAAALMDALPKMLSHFGIVVQPDIFKEACAAGAAILAALDLTFDLSNRARMHSMMKRRYYELLADLRAGKRTSDEVGVCLDQYSAEEEPPYKVLFLACWNAAQKTVFGKSALRWDISGTSLFFKNVFRRPAATFVMIYPDGTKYPLG